MKRRQLSQLDLPTIQKRSARDNDRIGSFATYRFEGGIDLRGAARFQIGDEAGKQAQVERAVVRVEKPGAVRFSKSVGVEIERTQEDGL